MKPPGEPRAKGSVAARTIAGGVRFARRPEFALGAWLNSFLAAMIIAHGGDQNLLFAALVGGAVLVVVLTWGRPPRYGIAPTAAWSSFLLLAAILAGYVANLERYELTFVLGNFLSMLLALLMAYLVATRLDLDWRLLLACQALVALVLIPEPVARGELVWGRLTPDGLHPNYLGMVAMLAFIGGLGVRPRLLRWLVLLATGAVMAAVSSRGAMLAAAVGALAYAAAGASCTAARAPAQTGPRSIRMALGMLCVVAGIAAAWLLAGAWIAKVGDLLFKIDDPYRGLDSGASGRTELWAAAMALWEAHPLLGVGFKGHTLLMPHGDPAHNAYLALLAETGILGLMSYLCLCAAAVAGLWRRRRDPRTRVSIAVLAAYLVYGLVETRAVGFGNAFSVLFLWIVFDSARRPAPSAVPSTPVYPQAAVFRPEGSPR